MTATITHDTPFFLSSASGWQINSSMQYEFGGLLLGNGTRFIVTSVKGLLGGTATGDSVRSSSGPGAVPANITDDPRMIEMVIETDATRAESQELIDLLEDAFQVPERWLNAAAADDNVVRGAPLSARTCLAYRRDGWAEPRIVFCRRINLDIESNFNTTTGRITANVRLQADNPRKYSMATYKTSVHLHTADLVGEFEWNNLGNYVEGYPMFVEVRCPGPNGYQNLRFYREYDNPFSPSGISTEELAMSFKWNKDFDVDFKQRITNPLGPLGHTAALGWFRIKPGTQRIGVKRSATSYNGPMDIHFYKRHIWS